MSSARGRGRRLLSPLAEFLRAETGAAVILMLATAAALIWANAAPAGYARFWHASLTVGTGQYAITEDLQHWINDGLMTVFFFVAGLEIKRELVTGELREPRAAALPALGALGGVLVPVALFTAIVHGGPGSRGWGIPMATDIAFAVGVLALAGARASSGAKLLMLTIAIVDDIIAVAVIAIFYAGQVAVGWLVAAVVVLGLIAAARGVVSTPWAYVLPALLAWYAVFQSGVPATVVGVALGLLTPARPVRGRAVLDQLEHGLHPVSAYGVVPLFALANAGVYLGGGVLAHALHSELTWAITVALLVGKTLGIAGSVFASRRAGVGALPPHTPVRQVWPVAALGGIGFTVALFITQLAFKAPVLIEESKIGILLGSVAAAALGLSLLSRRRG